MERRATPELLDSDAGTPAEVAASLLDLRWFNQWFGGVSSSAKLIETVRQKSGERELSLLEVASGSGFVPLETRRRVERAGITLKITLLDRAVSHLPPKGSIPMVAGDALNLPFHDSTFDLVSCSLFVHHLPPQDVVRFAREGLRVCRTAVLVNDLVRHRLHLALAYAAKPFYRSRLTRHDAPASVRQAYTVEEMRRFLKEAGAASVELDTYYLFRMGGIAWKLAARK